MGYSIRVQDWRYTAWFGFNDTCLVPDKTILGKELYDHRGDSGLWLDFPGETHNLAGDERHSGLVDTLHKRIAAYVQLKPDCTY